LDDARPFILKAAAAGLAIAAAAIAAAWTIERPLDLMINWIGLAGMIGLVLFYFLCWGAAKLRSGGFERLQLAWVASRIAFLVAIALLLPAWALAWMAGLAVRAPLLEAILLTLVGGVLIGIASEAMVNLLRAIRGPRRA
jgi:hypothetical protein